MNYEARAVYVFFLYSFSRIWVAVVTSSDLALIRDTAGSREQGQGAGAS